MRVADRRREELKQAHTRAFASGRYDCRVRLPRSRGQFDNFVRQHKTLRCSPAMAAGLSKTLWSMEDVVALIDAQAEPAKKRGPYKARAVAS